MVRLPVYLDNNATTKTDPRVVEAMLPFFSENFGNAASTTHLYGWEAKDAVDNAREQVATLIGASPNEIVFTSGATEAVNLAIKGICEFHGYRNKHIITVATEHKAVLDTCKHLQRAGVEVSWLPVSLDGRINTDDLLHAIRDNTILISVMYANNETGVVQDIEAIASLAAERSIAFFCDATQAAGKIPVNVRSTAFSMMAFSAHKLYGPKGIGALYVRRKNPAIKIMAQIDGGGHEVGLRSGTLNVPAIAGFGEACRICSVEMKEDSGRINSLRQLLENNLLQIEGAQLNGDVTNRLFNVCNISFKGKEGRGLMTTLSKHVALSSGSACTSLVQEPSYVLKAMGIADDLAGAAFRFSLGRFTTQEEIDYVVQTCIPIIKGYK